MYWSLTRSLLRTILETGSQGVRQEAGALSPCHRGLSDAEDQNFWWVLALQGASPSR